MSLSEAGEKEVITRAWTDLKKETDSPNFDFIAVPTWLCGSGEGVSQCVLLFFFLACCCFFSLPVKQESWNK